MSGEYFVRPAGPDLWVLGTSFVHAFLLVGAQRALLIDTGLGDFPVEKAVRTVTGKPLTAVCTHGHEDHAGGGAQLPSICLHPADHAQFHAQFPQAPTRLVPVQAGFRFDLGGLVVEVIETPGHTAGSITLIDLTHGRAFTGDLVDAGINVIPPNGGMHLLPAYLESTRRLTALADQFSEIYPSHGAFPLPAARLEEISACTAGILDGTLQSKAHIFRPDPNVPPLNGMLYDTGRAGILIIDRIPKLDHGKEAT